MAKLVANEWAKLASDAIEVRQEERLDWSVKYEKPEYATDDRDDVEFVVGVLRSCSTSRDAGRTARAGQRGTVVIFGKTKGRGSARDKEVKTKVKAFL